MRGRTRLAASGALVASAAATGGSTTGLAGALWAATGLGAAATPVAAALALAALGLDTLAARTGRPAPWCVPRQVPQAWGRLLGPSTAAALYGARLGVGPLTHLVSWTWWAGTAVAVTLGPGTALLAGSAFGAARMTVVAAAAPGLSRRSPAPAA